ncbi:MAG TPA: histidine phosphatase family protein [Planctomycetaceae bacterium]|jgi:probable phosphoglycerate mutase|nr:histidine phosphatase family protein [Planctomycetaceae bacterium]
MAEALPRIYLARHGQTEWSVTGQHTGLSDIPLTAQGEENARRLGERLAKIKEAIQLVLTSPLQRARRTAELAGFGSRAEVEPNLLEWNYGKYDGRTTADIRRERPDWQLFRDGVPEGETLAQVAARADRVIARLRAAGGNAILFSSGHILRVLAARWCGCDPLAGQRFFLGTASLSALGYEHNLQEPVIQLWNDQEHLDR